MKRSFVLLMAALLVLPACTKEFRTENLSFEEEIPFREGSDNSLTLNLDIDFPVSGFPKEALETIRRTIRTNTVGEAYADFTASLPKLAEAWRNALVQDYLTTNEGMLEELEVSEADAPFLNWSYEYKGAFGEAWDKYVNYTVNQYEYLGGAHGMYGIFPLVFNKEDGKAVDWKTVAPGVSEQKMERLLRQHRLDDMKETIEEDYLDEDNIFFSETIEPSNWFSVDEKGLTFYYQPYDIAPYVYGVITVPVPWEELR